MPPSVLPRQTKQQQKECNSKSKHRNPPPPSFPSTKLPPKWKPLETLAPLSIHAKK